MVGEPHTCGKGFEFMAVPFRRLRQHRDQRRPTRTVLLAHILGHDDDDDDVVRSISDSAGTKIRRREDDDDEGGETNAQNAHKKRPSIPYYKFNQFLCSALGFRLSPPSNSHHHHRYSHQPVRRAGSPSQGWQVSENLFFPDNYLILRYLTSK